MKNAPDTTPPTGPRVPGRWRRVRVLDRWPPNPPAPDVAAARDREHLRAQLVRQGAGERRLAPTTRLGQHRRVVGAPEQGGRETRVRACRRRVSCAQEARGPEVLDLGQASRATAAISDRRKVSSTNHPRCRVRTAGARRRRRGGPPRRVGSSRAADGDRTGRAIAAARAMTCRSSAPRTSTTSFARQGVVTHRCPRPHRARTRRRTAQRRGAGLRCALDEQLELQSSAAESVCWRWRAPRPTDEQPEPVVEPPRDLRRATEMADARAAASSIASGITVQAPADLGDGWSARDSGVIANAASAAVARSTA